MLIYSFYFATLCHFLPYFSQDVPHPSPFTCPSFSSNVAYCDSCSLSSRFLPTVYCYLSHSPLFFSTSHRLPSILVLLLYLPLLPRSSLPSLPLSLHFSHYHSSLLFSLFCRLSLSLNCCPSHSLYLYQPLSPVLPLSLFSCSSPT